MWLPILGLLLGLLIGGLLSVEVPAQYTRYTAMAILAALDSVLGAVRAEMEGKYNHQVFLTGFLANALLAALLTFIGDRLGVELYLAAIVAFGARLFDNLARIRRRLIGQG